jgi:hypothetical protein
MLKYDRNFSKLQKKASAKEIKEVFKFVGEEANKKQRAIVGLDK